MHATRNSTARIQVGPEWPPRGARHLSKLEEPGLAGGQVDGQLHNRVASGAIEADESISDVDRRAVLKIPNEIVGGAFAGRRTRVPTGHAPQCGPSLFRFWCHSDAIEQVGNESNFAKRLLPAVGPSAAG